MMHITKPWELLYCYNSRHAPKKFAHIRTKVRSWGRVLSTLNCIFLNLNKRPNSKHETAWCVLPNKHKYHIIGDETILYYKLWFNIAQFYGVYIYLSQIFLISTLVLNFYDVYWLKCILLFFRSLFFRCKCYVLMIKHKINIIFFYLQIGLWQKSKLMLHLLAFCGAFNSITYFFSLVINLLTCKSVSVLMSLNCSFHFFNADKKSHWWRPCDMIEITEKPTKLELFLPKNVCYSKYK